MDMIQPGGKVADQPSRLTAEHLPTRGADKGNLGLRCPAPDRGSKDACTVEDDGNVADHLTIAGLPGPDPVRRHTHQQSRAALSEEVALEQELPMLRPGEG